MEITVDKAAILTALEAEFEAKGLQEKLDQFLALIKHGNPFAQKVDGNMEGFEALQAANDGLHDLIEFTITVAQKTVSDAGAVGMGAAKLDAVVEFLDDKIKLPFCLEWLDGIIIRLLVSQAVTGMKKRFGDDWAQKAEALKAGA